MNLRRAMFVTAFALLSAAGPAAAQSQPQRQNEANAPPCIKAFFKLRDEAEVRSRALTAAQKRKAPLNEACKLLGAFAAAQDKMLKYAEANATWCGIPPQVAIQLKAGYGQTLKARNRVCNLAANPPPPPGPTLSDALGAGIPDASNIKRGSGTFDTLTGTPLGRP